jgi:quercetin dioxygenase-like cupin family protein
MESSADVNGGTQAFLRVPPVFCTFAPVDIIKRMIDVVRAGEAKLRKSFDVVFDWLAIGPQSMIAKMHYRPENRIPFHSHPNEHSGYIISGRTRVVTRDASYELGPGDSYVVPADVEHSIEVIEVTEELQVFTPPREDFR